MNTFQFVASLVIVSTATAAAAVSSQKPWASMGAFYAGMSKDEAKAAGYGACAHGTGSGESSDSVYCEIQPQMRKLGNLKIDYAKLEFKPPNLNRVHKIYIRVEAKQNDVLSTLKNEYGETMDGGRFYVWQRDTAHTIATSKRQLANTAWITFEFDPNLPAEIKKQQDAKKAKENTLKGF
jgi:hypothetical protein